MTPPLLRYESNHSSSQTRSARRLAVGGEAAQQLDQLPAGLPRERAEEVVLVGEVAVEAAMADAGRDDDVVDPGVVVAPCREHLRARVEEPASGLLAAWPQRAVAGRHGKRRDGGKRRGCRRGRCRAPDVDTVDGPVEQPVDDVCEAVDEALVLDRAGRCHGLPVEAAADQDGGHPAGQGLVAAAVAAAEGPQQRGVESGAERGGLLGKRFVVTAGGLEGGEDRRVALVETGEVVDPGHQPLDALGVGADRLEALSQVDQLAAQLPRQLPEHVVLAGEVLVEGRARAPRSLGDQLDPSLAESHLGEDFERGLQDAPLGLRATFADQRVAAERPASGRGRPVRRRHVTHRRSSGPQPRLRSFA